MNGTHGAANIILHAVVPVAALPDWIFLREHGSLRIGHTPCFLAYPFAYMLFIFIRAPFVEAGMRKYPYPFMDVAQRGVPTVAGTMVVMAAGFYLPGLLFKGVDSLLKRLSH